jgi:hypothetical protein
MAADTTTKPPPDPLTTPRSIDDLTQLAGSQIDAEIKGQTDPLQSQVTGLQGKETSALQQIGSLFGTLQPYVSGAADKVQSSYDAAYGASQSIFNTAQQRMTDLKNQRAQQAQNMAQQVGGPVAVGEFTASVLPQEQELAMTAPNMLLHQLADAQAGTQEARAFSENVFPLVQTEETAKSKGFFEDQIAKLNDEISTIQGSKQGKVNSRLNDLITQERGFKQQEAQMALDKLKASRDWQATQRTLNNDTARLKLAQASFKAQATGTYGGKPTLAAQKISSDEAKAQASLNLSKAQLRESIRHHLETEAVSQQKANHVAQANAMAILDHAMAPSARTSITLQHKVILDAAKGLITSGARKDPKTGQYYIYEKRTLTPDAAIAQGYNLGGNAPTTDPNKLYTILTGSNVSSALATKLIRTKTGIHDFSPGKDVNFSIPSLAGMSNPDVMALARARGWKGGGKRNELLHWIVLHNPSTPATP